MVRRLSDDARRLILDAAGEEARRRGAHRLGTDHLLLGLLHDPAGDATRALGVDLASARAALAALDRSALAAFGIDAPVLPVTTGPAPRTRLPLTSSARAVFRRAVENAEASRGRHIGTRDFLLALLAGKRPDPAAELLEALGVDPLVLRARLAP